jgi:hypothetical protein
MLWDQAGFEVPMRMEIWSIVGFPRTAESLRKIGINELQPGQLEP